MKKSDAQRLAAFFDDALGQTERAQVEAWLAMDPEARAELDRLRQARDELLRTHTGEPDLESDWLEFRNRLAALHRERRAPPQRLALPRVLAAAAAVLLLGIAVWWPLRYLGHESPGYNAVEFVETDLTGSTSVVFVDEPSGWTVVWVLPPDSPAGG